jgi:hypothetical protein
MHSATSLAGKQTDLLDKVESRGSGQLADHGPEHVAQGPNVAAEEIVTDHGIGMLFRRCETFSRSSCAGYCAAQTSRRDTNPAPLGRKTLSIA